MEHLYLIGKSIAHSKSPNMYNALFDKLGLDWRYELADLPSEREARSLMEGGGWLAANATTPYKALAYQVAQVKAASVQLSKGANFLLAREGVLLGLNTDGLGCVRHIKRSGYSFEEARVVVCGTGPTSLSILAAAAQAGAARCTLIGRDRDRTKEAAEGFVGRYRDWAYATIDMPPASAGERSFRAGYEETTFAFGTYSSARNEIAHADIVVDATPLGMNEGDPLPFDAELLGGQTLVYDVVYGHGESSLLKAARDAGCGVLDGCGMVVAQAVENAGMLLDAHGIDPGMDADALYDLMEEAAQFA